MRPTTIAEAVSALNDVTLPARDREAAIHYLAENQNPEGIDALVNALGDPQFSIRWAAADALRYAGDDALVPILRGLVQRGGSSSYRESAHHALSKNIDPAVRDRCSDLLKAMKGPAADMATPQAAFTCLRQLDPAYE